MDSLDSGECMSSIFGALHLSRIEMTPIDEADDLGNYEQDLCSQIDMCVFCAHQGRLRHDEYSHKAAKKYTIPAPTRPTRIRHRLAFVWVTVPL